MEFTISPKPNKSLQEDATGTNNESVEANRIQSDYIRMRIGNRYGVLNNAGDTILPCIYDYVADHVYIYKDKVYFIVGNSKLFGALDKLGKAEIPITYSSPEIVKSAIQKKVD